MILEFSFDDAPVGDQRAAALLEKYGFCGTFYYPSNPVASTWLDIKEMAVIAGRGHNIGGHTVNHPTDLKEVTDDKQLEFQIENNKALIERLITKRRIHKFAYPRGRHNERVREAVKKAGFTQARTTIVLKTDWPPEDMFQIPTTVHMFPRKEYNGKHWLDVAKEQLDIALSKGDRGYFHLWGHTNEMDLAQDWKNFEEILSIIKQKIS